MISNISVKVVRAISVATSRSINKFERKSSKNIFFHCKNSRKIHSKLYSDTDILFTETHEWLKRDGDLAVLGITSFGQEQLGEIAYCDLPDVGRTFEKGECYGKVESVSAASNLYMPLKAEIIERNMNAIQNPRLINKSPSDEGWLVRVRFTESAKGDISNLLDRKAYERTIDVIEKTNKPDNCKKW